MAASSMLPQSFNNPAVGSTVAVVFGATGQQGGSVARALAKSGRFGRVRLVTRKVGGESARAILDDCNRIGEGRTSFQLVEATFDDRASLDTVLAGAHYCFAVTNWWEHFFQNKPLPGEAGFVAGQKALDSEVVQGKNWVDAVRKAGVVFSVFSGLDDPTAHGYKHVYHYAGKGEVERYLLANAPGCSVRMPCYLQNLQSMIKPQPDGTLSLPIGQEKLPWMSVDDIGVVVDGIFKQVLAYGPQYWDKQLIGLAGDKITGAELADIWSKTTGRTVKFAAIPADNYAKLGFPGDAEMAEMFVFQTFHDTICRRDVALTRAIATGRVSTVFEWFAANSAAMKSF